MPGGFLLLLARERMGAEIVKVTSSEDRASMPWLLNFIMYKSAEHRTVDELLVAFSPGLVYPLLHTLYEFLKIWSRIV
jgi:hypothetical protein